MNLRLIVLSLVVAVIAVTIFPGCASAPDSADDLVAADGVDLDIPTAYELSAGWLPQESNAVIVGADTTIWTLAESWMLPTAIPDGEVDDPGSLKAFQADVEELFVEHLGFSPDHADAVTVGIHLGGATVVMLGDFGEMEGLEEIEVNERTGYKIDFSDGDFNDIDDHDLYLLPFDEPYGGLVGAMSIEALERLEEAQHEEDGGNTLASGARAEFFERLFGDTGDSSIAVASNVADLGPFVDQTEFPLPDAVVFDYGDHAGLTLEGDDEVLTAIEEEVAEWIGNYREKMLEMYEEDYGDFAENLAALYSYHGFESIAGQLEAQRKEDQLRYQIELSDMSWGGLSLMGMFVAAGLAYVIDPFDGYEFGPPAAPGGWGPPRAEEKVRGISLAAADAFEADQFYCGGAADCEHPWHDDVADVGDPVDDEDKTFPGGTDFAMSTMDEVPEEGHPEPVQLQFDEQTDADFDIDTVKTLLELAVEEEADVRYTYETGSEAGFEAKATITAETVLDPDLDRRRTITQTLEVDDEGRVIFSDLIVDEDHELDSIEQLDPEYY